MAKGSSAKNQTADFEDDFFSSESAPKEGTKHEDREIDGWYEPQEGVIAAGLLVGTLIIHDDEEDEDRRVALIELKRPIRAKLDDRPIELEPGKVLAIGERAKLAPLFTYQNGARVWLKPTGKKKLSGKRSPMWQFDLVVDGKEKPAAPF